MYTPSVVGCISIVDNTNLRQRLSLVGLEVVHLSFRSHSVHKTYNKKFLVQSISDPLMVSNGAMAYDIHLVTEEFFISESKRIRRGYKNRNISDIVKEILSKDISDNIDLDMDDTGGVMDIVLTDKTPYGCIHELARYANTTDDPHTTYMFFENRDGLNFKSIHNLFTNKSKFTYSKREIRDHSESYDINNHLGIREYKKLGTTDTLRDISSGKNNNSLVGIDYLTKSAVRIKYDYTEDYTKSNHVENSQLSYEVVFDSQVNKVIPIETLRLNSAYFKSKEGSSRKSSNLERSIPHRTALQNRLLENNCYIVISGNTDITVGDVITLEIDNRHMEKDNEYNRDTTASGKYLVYSVQHAMNSNSMMSRIYLMRDSIPKELI